MAAPSRDVDRISDDVDSATLTRTLMTDTQDADLALLLQSIQTSCKVIARAVRKAGIAGLYGLAGTANATGDDVKKLDLLSNDVMTNNLINSHVCAVLVSEEEEEPVIVPPEYRGRFCVAYDPLDGSSNIDCNVSTGTIFGVWSRADPEAEPSVSDILRSGHELVCAGYCMYGSATEFVLTYGHGVKKFTLDPSVGEFILTGSNITLPETCKTIYSVNEGNYSTWDEETQRAVDSFKFNEPKPYAARYVGSMVSDVHRTLLYGGVYMYPADKKKGNGKLRILYEGFPLSLIMQQAGGMSSTGRFRGKIASVLDVVPEHVHDRCPVLIGCERDVSRILSFYSEYGAEA